MSDAALRIIDANLNRAREALRTLEDHARLAWDDRELAARCKAMRHALVDIVDLIGGKRLLAARDIENDVGRDVRTSREVKRATPSAVVAAAFGRLSESLRVIAEYGKLAEIGANDAVAPTDALRYETYALQTAFELRGDARAALKSAGLYVIVTEAICRDDWRETANAVLEGGAKVLQLREKGLSDRELLDRASWLRGRTRSAGALLIINDRPDIARLCAADGAHVGQDDMSVSEARRAAGGGLLVGISTHTREQVDAAIAARPDYIAVGPMFQSTTKPQTHIAGCEMLAYARRAWDGTLVAIGGITPDNAASIRSAGADVLCVCSAVIGVVSPTDAVGAFVSGR